MDANQSASRPRRHEDRVVGHEFVRLLEVLWTRGREVPYAPVSASQLRVLYTLDRDEGINLRTLGELLGSAPSSVSRLCDRLEALGFVRRLPSQVSRRELELHLTGHGRTYLQELRNRRDASLLEMIEGMTPAAARSLLVGLTGFRDALGETGCAPGLRPADDARSA
ncbi:MarR family transcriptional regulator [Streptomyces tirandamycinicus]|uniref:MarR family transcriptional regulator n=1 Tax=Streptomyces tirandamycinicus TaxID=2174846 RepID=UPI001ABFB4F5|nr:MarR family transcriptional regulator [Streptomyces tirandamycinicus]